jgi:hypothetical protein
MPYAASLERHERQCPGHWPEAYRDHVMDSTDSTDSGCYPYYPNYPV